MLDTNALLHERLAKAVAATRLPPPAVAPAVSRAPLLQEDKLTRLVVRAAAERRIWEAVALDDRLEGQPKRAIPQRPRPNTAGALTRRGLVDAAVGEAIPALQHRLATAPDGD